MSVTQSPWDATYRTFETSLSPDECRERIRPHIATSWSSSVWDGRPLRGSLSHDGFSLVRERRFRFGLQTHLSGTFEETPYGSLVRLRLGLSRFTAIWLTAWYVLIVGMLLVSGYGIVQQVILGESPQPFLLPLVGAVGMLLVSRTLEAMGRRLGRHEADFMLRFVETTLEARHPASR